MGNLAGLLSSVRLEFLMSSCLSYLEEVVISEVFYINSTNSKSDLDKQLCCIQSDREWCHT